MGTELELCTFTSTTPGAGKPFSIALFASVSTPKPTSPPKRLAYVVTADNVRALALGSPTKPNDGLEARCGYLWQDESPDPKPARCAIALLQDYSEGWGWRHNRAEIRDLINLIEHEGCLNAAVSGKANQIYQNLDNPEGTTALYLRYLLLHCSSHYTKDLRNEVERSYIKAMDEALQHACNMYNGLAAVK